ncbi:MAG: hypothetical protein PVH85_28970 [Desulfobacterales bacterium]|jgi:hypothetical protein
MFAVMENPCRSDFDLRPNADPFAAGLALVTLRLLQHFRKGGIICKETGNAMKKFIEFKVKPDWDEIEKVRNESADFLQSHKLSDNAIHSLSMIISELIEFDMVQGFALAEPADKDTVTQLLKNGTGNSGVSS